MTMVVAVAAMKVAPVMGCTIETLIVVVAVAAMEVAPIVGGMVEFLTMVSLGPMMFVPAFVLAVIAMPFFGIGDGAEVWHHQAAREQAGQDQFVCRSHFLLLFCDDIKLQSVST
jgi:hypothetical protein